MSKPLVSLLASLLLLLGIGEAGAITFSPKGFDDLTTDAEQIFIGTATQSVSRRTDHGAIVTDFTFDDVEIIKGTMPQTPVKVTMLGGTVGSESLLISGAPTFHLGVRYLLFVAGNGSVMFPLVGGHQGIFQIRAATEVGTSGVYDYGGRPVIDLPTRNGRVLRDASTLTKSFAGNPLPQAALSTEAFVSAIRSRLVR